MAYIRKIYSLYGKNRMNIFEGRCNEQSKLIKASQEFFYNKRLIKFISYRKENAGSNYCLYVIIIKSRMSFRVNLHSIVCLNVKELEASTISEV